MKEVLISLLKGIGKMVSKIGKFIIIIICILAGILLVNTLGLIHLLGM